MIQGPPPAIIGRDREMAVLRAALVDALGGRGRLALISGEAGIGKSTLATAVADEAAKLGMPVALARAPETSGAPPYWLWTQALRAQLDTGQIPDRQLLASRQPILARILPELGVLQGEASTSPSSETDAERFRLAEEIASLLVSGGPELRGVVVLDDLHAADASSLEVLAHVSSRVDTGLLFIIATYRDAPAELTPPLQALLAQISRQPSTIRIPLSGFDIAAVRSQLARIIGRDVDAQLADQVHSRSGGNPFFVAEIGRLLAEDAGDHGLRTSATVPARARDVITWRLNRLPEDTRQVLECAALIGQDVPIDTLARACTRSAAYILAALEPAVAAAVLRRGRSPAWVRFAHALVLETIVEGLPLDRAAVLHEQVARAIEATRANSIQDWLPALALHWSASAPAEDSSRRTVEVARLAAEQAEGRLGFADAVPFWRIALDAAERARSDADIRAELQLGLARSLFRSGHVGEAVGVCLSAAREAEAAQRPDLRAAAALVAEGVTEPQWAAALIALAEAALGQLAPDQFALRARLHAQIGQLLHLTTAADREQREAEETARAVEFAERSGDRQALQAALRAHQFANTHPQGVDERVRTGQRMVRLGQEFGDPWPQLWGRLWCVDAFVQLGRLAEAEVDLDELEPVVEHLRWPTARWHLLRSRAAILQAYGRFDAALDCAERASAEISGSGLGRAVLTQTMFLERQSDLVGEVPGGEERRRRILEWVAVEQAALPRLVASLLREGDKDLARSLYARLPPPDRWEPVRYMLALHLADRLRAAIGLNLRDDVRQLAARLQPLAAWHVSLGSGTVVTLGSGFLYTGMAAAFMGDFDGAIADMTKSLDDNTRSGAVALAVVARQELAEVLTRRGAGADLDHARRLASSVLAEAQRLGMRPFVARASALLGGMPRRRLKSQRLTPRELEVARLVADGLTNRQIGLRLGISEKTAENHVDNILGKFGFGSRAQVAAWVASGAVEANQPLT